MGDVDEESKKLVRITHECLEESIKIGNLVQTPNNITRNILWPQIQISHNLLYSFDSLECF